MAFSLKRKTVTTVDRDYFFSENVAMQAGSKKPINDKCTSSNTRHSRQECNECIVMNNSELFFLTNDSSEHEIVSLLLSRIYRNLFVSERIPAKITTVVSMGVSIDRDINYNRVHCISNIENMSVIELILKFYRLGDRLFHHLE